MTAYQKYQLQWMIDHGHSLDDLMSELTQHQINGCEETVDAIFDEWEHEVGFSGEIWACEWEWKGCEGKSIIGAVLEQYVHDKHLPD